MTPDPSPAPKNAMASICAQMPHLSTGDRASLRRLFLTQSHQATGVVTGLLLRAEVSEMGADAFARWTLLAHVAAVLSGTEGRDPFGRDHADKLGRRLSEADYSTLRLQRLTSARGPALRNQIVRAARMLAAKGAVPVNLWTLHNLTHPDTARADAARLEVARDYFAADYAKNKKEAAA